MNVEEKTAADEITKDNVKSEKPAKIALVEIKTIDNELEVKQLPDDNQNNNLNLIDCNIKMEINVEDELIVHEISANKDRSATMKRSVDIEIESAENPEIKKIKTEQNESTRRRSLRNETAASIKKKPPKYEEIFNCYKRKEYKECIIYLELVSSMAKDCIEYSILKAACYIHLGQKISEANKILDDVLKLRPDNVFTIYAKGLAAFHEQKWKESIKYFEKALEIDKASMERAEIMLKIANENLEKEETEQEKMSIPAETDEASEEEEDDPEEVEEENYSSDHEEEEDDEQTTVKESKHAMNIRKKRFGCELCGNKYFGKKFNLDRHNRTIHNRDTPYIAPLPRNYGNRKSSTVKAKIEEEPNEEDTKTEIEDNEEEEEEENNDDDYEDIDDELVDIPISKKKQKFKIRLGGGKISKAASLPSLAAAKSKMARCKVCKKMYRKGSLARHEIIHTGNKPHKCDQCPMAFYQKSDLQRHLTIHSDNFDFECELCDKKFRIKKNLQVHNKRHHSNIV